MAPGQQHYPDPDKEVQNKQALTPSEIVDGANQEDQLEKMRQNAPKGNEGKETGAEPRAYNYHRQT
ncbi:hypothetical protein DJ568_09065 [Mucilaginibacter hurinus]|uniref:Uncharacterized protein n=2 Tax=Mucilaginibacter hurinus TaxID=2201324 RepID=A0A367GPW2_9SPHI|nr:hypothetical protein DJ568_09065 [Mucilaginibacter hurinus]